MKRYETMAMWLGVALLLSTANSAGRQGTVSGRAVDAQGRPIAGAKIWVKPVVTTGLYATRTDANGRYEATGLPPVGYRVLGWFERQYNGKRYCLRLGHRNSTDYDPLNPAQGATRDLLWRTSGRIEDLEPYSDMGYFGGSISVMSTGYIPARSAPLEFTLTPQGPLIDGSTGKTLVRKPNAEGYILDVPVGRYKVSAVMLEGGSKKPIRLGSTTSSLGATLTFEFPESTLSCVGSSASGVERAHLYWDRGSLGAAAPATPVPAVAAPVSVPVSHDPSGTSPSSLWDGTITAGGETYFVRYSFTVQDDDPSNLTTLWKGTFYQCEAPSKKCQPLGSAQGVRDDNSISLVTTLSKTGERFVTDGEFSGDRFHGTTNAVFRGATAEVELHRQP